MLLYFFENMCYYFATGTVSNYFCKNRNTTSTDFQWNCLHLRYAETNVEPILFKMTYFQKYNPTFVMLAEIVTPHYESIKNRIVDALASAIGCEMQNEILCKRR